MLRLRAHLLAVVLVVAAVAGTAAVFLFARPEYRPRDTSVDVDMTTQSHYTGAEVVRAFATQGIRLVLRNRLDGLTIYSEPGSGPSAFQVTIFPPTSSVSFPTGGVKAMFEKHVGNVDVSYGGHSTAFAARVAAATAELGR
jgi:hypothetical protein